MHWDSAAYFHYKADKNRCNKNGGEGDNLHKKRSAATLFITGSVNSIRDSVRGVWKKKYILNKSILEKKKPTQGI